jgi:hypothetical protein
LQNYSEQDFGLQSVLLNLNVSEPSTDNVIVLFTGLLRFQAIIEQGPAFGLPLGFEIVDNDFFLGAAVGETNLFAGAVPDDAVKPKLSSFVWPAHPVYLDWDTSLTA